MLQMTKLIVWYDSTYPLCSLKIALVRRLDRRGAVDVVDVSKADPTCPIDAATMLARFHASKGSRLLSGAAAFAAMWRAIPMLRQLGLAARTPLVLALLERIYLVHLRFRPRLQRLFAARLAA